MAKTAKESAIFLDGCVVDADTFFFSSRLDALPEGEYFHARIVLYRQGEWFFQDRHHEVVSVCVRRENAGEPVRASCALERMSGRVGLYLKGEAVGREEVLPGPEGSFGPMSQIAQIGQTLFCCGVDGTVFKREGGHWLPFNQGLNADTLLDYQAKGHTLGDAISLQFAHQHHLLSIGGGEGDLFACGRQGLVCHRGDGVWKKIDVLTNANLSRIKYLSSDLVYAVGSNGVVLKGSRAGFQVLASGVKDDFTCLEWFKGALYIGGYKGVYVFKDDKLTQVASKGTGDVGCVALSAYGDQLLAVAERGFSVFDGKTWNIITHPDN